MKAECISRGEPRLFWIKSSYSSEEGGECVEVAACPHRIHVRDSKDTARPGLAVGPDTWDLFVVYAVDQIN
ncbi:hypothetical protein QFZ22_007093 [Streptomyces canus]|uniref:DUF397 domain-containing protein n=1 Tax=Streptomyces canus TaxID=58343 RepID=A0AAW8FQN6_9ACTN|nr:DUF397 domain-containing protein [Streptomyces canus]MDQ0911108.1 hypothetical protein [Streptomyces canus]